MGKVKVLIKNNQDVCKIPSGVRFLIKRSCRAVLQIENFRDDAEISVFFIDNRQMRDLNFKYRQKDTATDVLSFPTYDRKNYTYSGDGVAILGDIVISFEKAVEQARENSHSLQRELAYLAVHSMLHLLNYNHENGGLEEVRMREKEEMILSQIGLNRSVTYATFNHED